MKHDIYDPDTQEYLGTYDDKKSHLTAPEYYRTLDLHYDSRERYRDMEEVRQFYDYRAAQAYCEDAQRKGHQIDLETRHTWDQSYAAFLVRRRWRESVMKTPQAVWKEETSSVQETGVFKWLTEQVEEVCKLGRIA